MEPIFSAIEIWQLAVVKLLFYLFIAAGIFFWFKLRKPILFVILISLFLASTYLVLIYQSQLTWWGLQGDEIFVTAFLEQVASGNFFSDFFYSGLPSFYPPLYFWLVGGLAWIFGLNGIRAAQLGVTLVLFITPFLVYFCQRLYRPKKKIASWKLVIPTALIFVVADWTAVILKPYEFISAVLIIFWTLFLLFELDARSLNWKKIIFYGIGGGLLFLTFYFWFFPIIFVLALFKLFTKTNIKYYFSRLTLVGILVGLVSLPYILPLLSSYFKFGSENWQAAFFIPQDLNLYLPFLNFSIFGLVAMIGVITMILYWSKVPVKILGLIFISTYIWQFFNLLAIILWQAPFLPAKPFLFLGGATLSISAAYGFTAIISEKIKDQKIRTALFVLAWIVLATQLLGGSFLDQPEIPEILAATKEGSREEFVNLVNQLKQVDGVENMTILSSGIPQLSAYLPLSYYISYNMHFSHPAANFLDRFRFVSNLASSDSPVDFYQKLQKSPFEKIDALLFFKADDYYSVHFWVDYYPFGGGEQEIKIPKDLINEQYFAKVFEDKHFVFYKPR